MKAIQKLLLLGSLFLCFSERLEAQWEALKGRALDEIADLEISGDLDLFEDDGEEFYNYLGNYGYAVEPGYQRDQFIRHDRWRLNAGVSWGTKLIQSSLEDKGALPVSLILEKGSAVNFYRLYNKQHKGFLALPLTPLQMPLSAESLQKLPKDTIVEFPAKMRLGLGTRLRHELAEGLQLQAYGNAFVEGEFRLLIHHLGNGKVRVNIKGGHSKNLQLGVKVKSGMKYVDMEANKNVQKAVDKIFKRNVLDWKIWRSERGLSFAAEYTLDTKNPEAAHAYQQILGNTYKFRDVSALLNARSEGEANREKLEGLFTPSLKAAEALAERDRDKENPVVTRGFRGSNRFVNSGSSLGMNLFLYKRKGSSEDSVNFLRFFTHGSGENSMVLSNYSRRSDSSLVMGIGRERKHVGSYVASKSDTQDALTDASNQAYGFKFELRDKRFFHVDYVSMRNTLAKGLSPALYKEIEADLLNLDPRHRKKQGESETKVERASIQVHSYFHPGVLNEIKSELDKKGRSRAKRNFIKEELTAYIKELESKNGGQLVVNGRAYSILRFWDKRQIAKRMIHFFEHSGEGGSQGERLKAFIKLNKDPLFQEIGFGFMIRLMGKLRPDLDYRKFVRVDLKYDSTQTGPVEKTYLAKDINDLYTPLEETRRNINSNMDPPDLYRHQDRENQQHRELRE